MLVITYIAYLGLGIKINALPWFEDTYLVMVDGITWITLLTDSINKALASKVMSDDTHQKIIVIKVITLTIRVQR
mgnify:CR=1 FL=1